MGIRNMLSGLALTVALAGCGITKPEGMPLPGGYRIDSFDMPKLRVLSGVEAGTANLVQTRNGYLIDGTYSQLVHPEAMESVSKKVDANNDKYLSRKELENYSRSLISK